MANKKRFDFIILFLLVITLSFTSVSALSIEMKESFQKQETAIAKISGANSLSQSQISFYRGNSEVALENGLVKIGDFYYIWFITPSTENNYSIMLQDVFTLNGKKTLSKNFNISNETSEYYVKPGAIIAQKDFSINLFSNQESSSSLEVNYPYSHSITISLGENNINFQFNESQTKISTILVGKYSIPVYFIGSGSSPIPTANSSNNSNSNITLDFSFYVSPKKINRTENKNDSLIYTITIYNNGTKNLSNIILEYNRKIISLSSENIDNISINQSASINLTILGQDNISEVVFAKKGNYSVAISVQITRLDSNLSNTTNSSLTKINNQSGLYDCVLELQGLQCLPDQLCTKGTSISRQGTCCLGSCYYPEKKSTSSWLGWIIALIVLVVIGYLLYRYKSVKPTNNPIEKQVKEIEKKETEKSSLTPNSLKK